MRALGRVFRRIIVASVTTLLSVWVLSICGVLVWGVRDGARRADAIVVLGAAQYVGRPSPVLRARLDHAFDLWKRGLAPRVVLTGGPGVGDTTSEAAVGRRYMIRRGVPDASILVETESHSTSESLESVAAMMHARKLQRAILVSDPFHMLRLQILAKRYELESFTSPTKTSPISANRNERIWYVLSESVKVPMTLLLSIGPMLN
jgi:uncharacterized SAM-binding protein YcdF (DUF218 family)